MGYRGKVIILCVRNKVRYPLVLQAPAFLVLDYINELI